MIRRIGMTLRRELWEQYGETRDSFDISWKSIFIGIPSVIVPIPNFPDHVSAFCNELDLDALVLTGGASVGTSSERDETELGLLREAIRRKMPVLGICRGMQMINSFLGGTFEEDDRHVGQRHSVSGPLFDGFVREVNSYHRLTITSKSIADGVTPLAMAEDGTIEAFTVNGLPWLGLMWHPEREFPVNECDLTIVRKWLNGN